jgi:hypothetical protein
MAQDAYAWPSGVGCASSARSYACVSLMVFKFTRAAPPILVPKMMFRVGQAHVVDGAMDEVRVGGRQLAG